jgi:multimeric flavodoxin WrbA
MKAIIYASVHHGNTKKVVEAIAQECEVELIDATQVKEKDLSGYDTFGPFKLIGGLAKGHPDDKDLENAVAFFRGLE